VLARTIHGFCLGIFEYTVTAACAVYRVLANPTHFQLLFDNGQRYWLPVLVGLARTVYTHRKTEDLVISLPYVPYMGFLYTYISPNKLYVFVYPIYKPCMWKFDLLRLIIRGVFLKHSKSSDCTLSINSKLKGWGAMLAQRGQSPYRHAGTHCHKRANYKHETPFCLPPHQMTPFVYACVCVCVCMCEQCTCVCVHLRACWGWCMHTCTCARACLWLYACVGECMCVRICVRAGVCTCTCVHVRERERARTFVYTCARACTIVCCVYIWVHKYACTYVCMCACVQGCVHTYVRECESACAVSVPASSPPWKPSVGLACMPLGQPCSYFNSGASVSAADPFVKPLAAVEPCDRFPSMRDTALTWQKYLYGTHLLIHKRFWPALHVCYLNILTGGGAGWSHGLRFLSERQCCS